TSIFFSSQTNRQTFWQESWQPQRAQHSPPSAVFSSNACVQIDALSTKAISTKSFIDRVLNYPSTNSQSRELTLPLEVEVESHADDIGGRRAVRRRAIP